MKNRFSDYSDLFTILLDSYEFLEKERFSTSFDCQMLSDLIQYFKDKRHDGVSFIALVIEFFKTQYDVINRDRVMAFIMAIDDSIYLFDEYYELFENKVGVTPHHNSEYYVLIRPKFSLTKLIDEKENLRDERFAKQNTIVEKLNLKRLCFFHIDKDFNYCVKYTEMKSLETKVASGDLTFKYLHMVNCVKYGEEIVTKPFDEFIVDINSECFSIDYKNQNNYADWYLRSLEKALVNEENDIIIIPEITTSNDALKMISSTISSKRIKRDALLVCGSNWNNRASVINIFNTKSELLMKHNKYVPFEDVVVSNNKKLSVSEDIDIPKQYTINLLHIKDVGLFGFMICSDLLSDSLRLAYVKARISNLIMCSFSYSSDIFYDLKNLAAKYNIVSSACNVCFPGHKADGYLFLPKKTISKRDYLCIESKKCSELMCINCDKEECCGSSIKSKEYL